MGRPGPPSAILEPLPTPPPTPHRVFPTPPARVVRINLSYQIRIRIQIADLDLDPGGQKRPTKIEKNTEFSRFEVLDVLI
jgi:hypothetical protein